MVQMGQRLSSVPHQLLDLLPVFGQTRPDRSSGADDPLNLAPQFVAVTPQYRHGPEGSWRQTRPKLVAERSHWLPGSGAASRQWSASVSVPTLCLGRTAQPGCRCNQACLDGPTGAVLASDVLSRLGEVFGSHIGAIPFHAAAFADAQGNATEEDGLIEVGGDIEV